MLIAENKINKIISETIHRYINESKINLSKMIFVAFGTDKFDMSKVRPVDTDGIYTLLRNKPSGGVWASPIVSKNGWADWCNANDFRLKTLSKHFLFSLKPNAKIYVIDDLDDLKRISTTINYQLQQKTINFKLLVNNGYDGIFVTDNAASELRYVERGYAGLDTWDVESICIFNPDVIVPIEEDAFEKAKINKYGKPYYDNFYDEDDSNSDDRKYLQMQSDFDRYSNQNLNSDMSKLFKGKHPSIMAQQHGNSKDAKLARKFNGTVKSGMNDK